MKRSRVLALLVLALGIGTPPGTRAASIGPAVSSGQAAIASEPAVPADVPPAMVVLVRHAEKASYPAGNPPLTPEGTTRANALAAALADAGVTAIITTQWTRTRDTAAPLARTLNLTPQVVRTGQGDTAAHAAAVAAAVRRHPGGIVLVVGHSNTIPAIIAALGGPRLRDICDPVFDDLFTLVPVRAGAADSPGRPSGWAMLHARYGAPSPVAAGCR
jgi:phosphohistidine phosphatase SixA